MSARQWVIGCLIGLAGMGSAMAVGLGARETSAINHSATGTCARDTGSSNGGDTVGFGRDCPSPRRGNDADNGDADGRANGVVGGGEHDGRLSAPNATKPTTLGWQSLLPGSIQ